MLHLAASMGLSKHVYVENGIEVYEVEEVKEAVITIIDRHYLNDFDKQFQTLKNNQDFRSESGTLLGTLKLIYAAKNRIADGFWHIFYAVDPIGYELFKKLVNGYSGQGESERMKKQVKKFRTTTRNRQSHAVTSAYMESDLIFSMIRRRDQGIRTSIYIDCFRNKILEM